MSMNDDKFYAEASWIAKRNYGYEYPELKKKKMVSIKPREYFVFLNDFENKWDCVGEFKTYEEALECSEKYKSYGEVKIMIEGWAVIKEGF